jgi:hypothetical protein
MVVLDYCVLAAPSRSTDPGDPSLSRFMDGPFWGDFCLHIVYTGEQPTETRLATAVIREDMGINTKRGGDQ